MKLLFSATALALSSQWALATTATEADAPIRGRLRSNEDPASSSSHSRHRILPAGQVGTFLQSVIEYDDSKGGRRLRKLESGGSPHSETRNNVEFPGGQIYTIVGAPEGYAKGISSGQSVVVPGGATIDEAAATIDFHGRKPENPGQGSSDGGGGNPNESTGRRNLQAVDVRTVLAVRVNHVGPGSLGLTTDDTTLIANDIFGSSVGMDDQVNLHSQYLACSHGQLNFQPSTNNGNPISNHADVSNIENGVVTVTVRNADCSAGNCDAAIRNEVNNLLGLAFGSQIRGGSGATHVMHCLPEGSMGGIAYAYINSWNSVYKNKWCQYVSGQLHELGHNLNLAHSNEGTQTYADQTGFMGYSYSQDDQKMCFNNAKNWQLGWFTGAYIDVAESSSYNGLIKGQVMYTPGGATQTPVVVRAGDYYIGFNFKSGDNSATVEGGNQVTIQRYTGCTGGAPGSCSYEESWLEAKLGIGGSWSKTVGSNQLTVTVNSIDTTAGQANVDITFGCTNDAQCQDGNTCNGAEVCSSGVCMPGNDPITGACCGNDICDAGESEFSCPQDCKPQITLGTPISDSTVGLAPFTTGATCGTTDGTGGAKMYELRDASGSVTLSLCTGTSFDSKIRVYTSSGACVTGNDDSCSLQSSVTFNADAGVIYHVWVHGYGANEGAFTLTSTGTQGPAGPTPPPTPAPTNEPTPLPTPAPTPNPTNFPTPQPTLPGFCSDGTGRCSAEEMGQCACYVPPARKLGDVKKSVLKGNAPAARKLQAGAKPVKNTPPPTPPPSTPPPTAPQPTNDPTPAPTPAPIACECWATQSPTPNPTPAPTPEPTDCTLAAVGDSCRDPPDCCSGKCSGGKPADRVCLA